MDSRWTNRWKSLTAACFFILIAATVTARTNYTCEQLDKQLFSHPGTSAKEVYRYLYAAKKSGNQLLIGKGYYLLGRLAWGQSNTLQSAKAYQKSLQIFRKAGNEKMQAKLYHGIGAMYVQLEDYNRALFYHRKDMQYQLSKGDSISLANAYLSLAIVKGSLGEKDSSITYYNAATSIYRIKKQIGALARTYLMAVEQCYNNGDNSLGLAYAYKALRSAQLCHDTTTLHGALTDIGAMYKAMGKPDSAKVYLLRALDLSTVIKAVKIESLLCKALSKIYDSQDSMELAHLYLKRSLQLNDSLHSPARVTQVNKIRFAEQTSGRQHPVYFLLYGFPLLIAGGGLAQYIRSRKKQASSTKENPPLFDHLLEKEISKQQKELVSQSIRLQQQNQLIQWTRTELANLKPADREKSKVSDVLSLLASAQQSTNWREFEQHFNDFHPGFYEKLLADYPHLTVGERLLCGFISLNLSNKEISGVTRKSVRSIEVAKYRLRRKLEIAKDQQLSAKLAKYL